MTGWRDLVDEQLADLNDRASRELQRYPPPDGLPPPGTWIRAFRLDDDARAHGLTPWHWLAGWNGRTGNIATRCRRLRPGRALGSAVANYIGDPGPYADPRTRLGLELEQPAEFACQQCMSGLERDALAAAAADQARRLEELVGILPAIEALVADQAIDDATRGARLRALWPVAADA